MSLTMEVSREQEIITEINKCLEYTKLNEKDTDEVAEELFRRLDYSSIWSKDFSPLNLQKFCSSLTGEEITWEPQIRISGTMECAFTVTVPSKFTRNPELYLEDLEYDDVIPEYTQAIAEDTWIEYRAEISSTDEVFEKLRNSYGEVVS